jgi:hypothetical protein
MSAGESLSSEAQSLLHALLCQYARSAAHEASNLLFLEEIAANTGKIGAGDRRAGLETVRRQMRLVALALAPEQKQRATRVGELAGDLLEVIGKQTSLRPLLDWEVAEPARALCLRERPGHAQLLLQHLIEDAARALAATPRRPQGPLLSVRWRGDEDGIEAALAPLDDAPLPAPSALARELAAANAFGLAHENGGALVRVWMPLADGA